MSVKRFETSGRSTWGYLSSDSILDGVSLIQTLAGSSPGPTRPPVESFGVREMGGIQDGLATVSHIFPGAVMNRTRGIKSNPGMAMFSVIVLEEQAQEHSCVINAGKVAGEGRAILQCLERRL